MWLWIFLHHLTSVPYGDINCFLNEKHSVVNYHAHEIFENVDSSKSIFQRIVFELLNLKLYLHRIIILNLMGSHQI